MLLKAMESNESIQIPEFTDRGDPSIAEKCPIQIQCAIRQSEFSDKENPSKRQKLSTKPLFKMKIVDLQTLECNEDGESFQFKNHELSLVMCGGKISDIFRDDFIFAFDLDDGSGTISCFHKFKYDREAVLQNLSELPTSARFLQTTLCQNQTRSDNETVFNVTNDNTVLRSLENNTSETFQAILTWFQNEIVEKPKARNVGDLIHVMGHLILSDGCRKINVMDFRMVTNEDREDLAIEIDYLNRCVY